MPSSVGIDLGSTILLGAARDPTGHVGLVPDPLHPTEVGIPASVWFREGVMCIGQRALDCGMDDFRNPAITDLKEHLGNPSVFWTDDTGSTWRAEELLATLVQKIIRDASTFSADSTDHLVIPASPWLSDAQINGIRCAARLAGIPSIEILPQGAAIAYSAMQGAQPLGGTTLVVDAGSGPPSAAILDASEDIPITLATAFAPVPLRDLLDRPVEAIVLEQLGTGMDLRARSMPVHAPRVLRHFGASPKLAYRRWHWQGSVAAEILISAGEIERLAAGVVKETIDTVNECLNLAGMSLEEISHVIVHGRVATLAPVLEQLGAYLASDVRHIVKAAQGAVATGALGIAEHSAALLEKPPEAAISNAPYDLGVRSFDSATNQYVVEVLIPRGTQLPARVRKTVHTNRSDQRRIVVELARIDLPGGHETSLGYEAFGPIESPEGAVPVTLEFSFGTNGRRTVAAFDGRTGHRIPRMADEAEGYEATWIEAAKGRLQQCLIVP